MLGGFGYASMGNGLKRARHEWLNFRPENRTMIIEIRPHPRGWKAFEGPGVEPVFREKDEAISYAKERHRKGEIRVMDSAGNVEKVLSLVDQTRTP